MTEQTQVAERPFTVAAFQAYMDEGKLMGHHVIWNYPTAPRMDCTITELIFVPDHALDGLYLLNLQVAAFENDAAPSRPVIFALREG